MGSYPTFDPAVLAQARSRRRSTTRSSAPGTGAPQFNRAIGGGYPTGSTFKADHRARRAGQGRHHAGHADQRPGRPEGRRAGRSRTPANAVNGTISLRRALQVSSDVFFYTLGRDTNGLQGQVIQSWARKLGLGRPTRHRHPRRGRRHDPRPRRGARDIAEREIACEKRRKVASCGISDKRPWSVGDNIQLAVGQGDVQASPLQLADRLRGDRERRPRRAPAPRAWRSRTTPAARSSGIPTPAARKVAIDDGRPPGDPRRPAPLHEGRRHVGQGLRRTGTSPRYPVFGKTGTAERPPRADQSWYVAYVPHPGEADRHRRDRRGRRLRLRRRRPDHLPHARDVVQPEGLVRSRPVEDELMAAAARSTQGETVAVPRAARRSRCRSTRSSLLAVHRRSRSARSSRSARRPPTTSPATRTTSSQRQAVYFAVGGSLAVRAVAASTTRGCARSSSSSTAC